MMYVEENGICIYSGKRPSLSRIISGIQCVNVVSLCKVCVPGTKKVNVLQCVSYFSVFLNSIYVLGYWELSITTQHHVSGVCDLNIHSLEFKILMCEIWVVTGYKHVC